MNLQYCSGKDGHELNSFPRRKMESNNGWEWEDENVDVEGCSQGSLAYAPFNSEQRPGRVKHGCDNYIVPCFPNVRNRVV